MKRKWVYPGIGLVILVWLFLDLTVGGLFAQSRETETSDLRLSREAASNFARLALRCIQKEFPNKLDHVMNDSSEVKRPRALHPSFYGCFDWHSAVHGHWMLVRLLKLFPDLPEAAEIRRALEENLSAENVQLEVDYLHQPHRKSFERTYGWAWLLKLSEELTTWDDPQSRKWARNLQPLTRAIVERYRDFLPKQTYPIRTGVHPNTAFGLAFALDYARAVGDTALERLVLERSRDYYLDDSECPIDWEPGGEDFFSPCLMEADLMRRVLATEDFRDWLEEFLPGLTSGAALRMFAPAIVTDRSDPKIVHLDGLNLSRAWCLLGIASAFPEDSPAHRNLVEAALRHARASLPYVTSGDYAGEHWLASFAVLMLSYLGD